MNSMDQSPSSEANNSSASQEVPFISWNMKVHFHFHKSLTPVPVLSHILFMPSHPVTLRFILYNVMHMMEVRCTYAVFIRTLEKRPLERSTHEFEFTDSLTGFCENSDGFSGSVNMGNYIRRQVIINASVKTRYQEVRYLNSYFLLFFLCRCVNPMVTVATVLTNDTEIFQGGLSVKESIRTVKKSFHPSSDHVSIARLYHEWETLHAEDAIDALIFSQQKGLNNEKMKLISGKK